MATITITRTEGGSEVQRVINDATPMETEQLLLRVTAAMTQAWGSYECHRIDAQCGEFRSPQHITPPVVVRFEAAWQ
jgi:hypothetical protein